MEIKHDNNEYEIKINKVEFDSDDNSDKVADDQRREESERLDRDAESFDANRF